MYHKCEFAKLRVLRVSRSKCSCASRASCITCSLTCLMLYLLSKPTCHRPCVLLCFTCLTPLRPSMTHVPHSYPMCSCASHGFCPTGSHASYVSLLTCSDVSLTSYLTCSTVNNSDMQPPLKECYCNVFFFKWHKPPGWTLSIH